MVDEGGLEVKIGIGPTRGKLREVLTVSKIDVPPKTDVPHGRVLIEKLGIFTMGELTGAKIGANVAGDDKIEVKTGRLTVHTARVSDTSDEVTTVVDDLVIEDIA